MKTEYLSSGSRAKLLLAVVLLVVCLTASVGFSLARYRDKTEKNVTFASFESGVRLGVGKWVIDEGSCSVPVTLSNGEASSYLKKPTKARICLAASIGIQSAENLTVKLKLGGVEYTAKAEKIKENSALYNSFGAGFVYDFYGADEKVLELEFSGTEYKAFSGTVTVAADVNNNGMLMLFAL